MAATQKALALARNFIDMVNQRLGAGTAAQAFDSNNDVCVTVTVGAGNNSVKSIVRFKPIALPTTVVDALGLAQRVVSPHVVQFVFDDTTYGTTTTDAQKAAILVEVLRLGTKYEWYSMAVGASVLAVANANTTIFVAGNLKLAMEPELQWRDLAAI